MDPVLWIKITDSHSYHFLKGPLDSEFIIYSFIPITLLTICLSRYLVRTDSNQLPGACTLFH